MRDQNDGMTWEHALIVAVLGISIGVTGFVAHLAFLAYRSSKQSEGLTAATYLEARKALMEHRRS